MIVDHVVDGIGLPNPLNGSSIELGMCHRLTVGRARRLADGGSRSANDMWHLPVSTGTLSRRSNLSSEADPSAVTGAADISASRVIVQRGAPEMFLQPQHRRGGREKPAGSIRMRSVAIGSVWGGSVARRVARCKGIICGPTRSPLALSVPVFGRGKHHATTDDGEQSGNNPDGGFVVVGSGDHLCHPDEDDQQGRHQPGPAP